MSQIKELERLKKYWLSRLDELEQINKKQKNKNPWILLCVATYINYVANITIKVDKSIHKRRDRVKYIRFIKKHLTKVNPLYKNSFSVKGKKHLIAEVMYDFFRNGLVHSMSLKPNRHVSILHKKEAEKKKVKNLDIVIVTKGRLKKKVVLLVAEDLLFDLKKVTHYIFSIRSKQVKRQILTYSENFSPVEGGWEIIS